MAEKWAYPSSQQAQVCWAELSKALVLRYLSELERTEDNMPQTGPKDSGSVTCPSCVSAIKLKDIWNYTYSLWWWSPYVWNYVIGSKSQVIKQKYSTSAGIKDWSEMYFYLSIQQIWSIDSLLAQPASCGSINWSPRKKAIPTCLAQSFLYLTVGMTFLEYKFHHIMFWPA